MRSAASPGTALGNLEIRNVLEGAEEGTGAFVHWGMDDTALFYVRAAADSKGRPSQAAAGFLFVRVTCTAEPDCGGKRRLR